MSHATIHTDGGINKKTNTGSWAFVVSFEGDEIFSQSGTEEDTTSNRMEITAIKKALELVIERDLKPFVLYSDSQYCVNSFNGWMDGWAWHDWRTSTGNDVKNVDLWKEMFEIKKKLGSPIPKLKWVRGHNGNKFNERADYLCNKELGRV